MINNLFCSSIVSTLKNVNKLMKHALKEWNITTEALGKGLVIAVWRKGDEGESFEVKQNEFLLMPTFIHQSPQKIKKDYLHLFNLNHKPNNDNQVKIQYWAFLEEEIIIDHLEKLLYVSNELINTNEHLTSSWDLYPEHKGKILMLRVYELRNPVLVTYTEEYSNSKSWVDLKIDIPKAHSKPVLPYKDFNKKARLIKSLLGLTAKPKATVIP